MITQRAKSDIFLPKKNMLLFLFLYNSKASTILLFWGLGWNSHKRPHSPSLGDFLMEGGGGDNLFAPPLTYMHHCIWICLSHLVKLSTSPLEMSKQGPSERDVVKSTQSNILWQSLEFEELSLISRVGPDIRPDNINVVWYRRLNYRISGRIISVK